MAFLVPSITSASESLRLAVDTLKTFMNIRDEVKRQEAVFELQAKILEAQSQTLAAQQEYSAIVAKARDLETKISEMEAWAAEKGRYELYEVSSGCFAFRIKQAAQSDDPLHPLCPNCFADCKKSILQRKQFTTGRLQTLACHRCGLEIVTHGVVDPTSFPSLAKGRR